MAPNAKRTVTAAVVQQLSLLQVLLMLPVDALRVSFARYLSAADVGHFRLTCKDAYHLAFTFTCNITLKFQNTVRIPELTDFVQKFLMLTGVTLQLDTNSAKLYPSFVSELLYAWRPQLKCVTALTLVRIPWTYAASLATHFYLPKLAALTLGEGCELEADAAVFDPMTSLVTLTLDNLHPAPINPARAGASLWAMPNITKLSMSSFMEYKLLESLPSTHSCISHLCLNHVQGWIVGTLVHMPCLEELEIRGSLECQDTDFSDSFSVLKHLKLHGDQCADALFSLLSRCSLETLRWEDAELVMTQDTNDGVPVPDWPAKAAAGLQTLQRLCKASLFPPVFLMGEGESPQQVTSFLGAWPVLPECMTLRICGSLLDTTGVQCLLTKVPNVTNMLWDHVYKSCDDMLYLLPEFKRLQEFELVGQTAVSAMGLTIIGVLLGQRGVRIGVSEADFSSHEHVANLDWVNDSLAKAGIQASFF